MSSHILDKLEALKSNEIKLKEERRVLEEQLELEIEKKRRMKLDGTLTKMEVQVDALAENFKGDLMPDNRILVYRFGKHNFTRKEIQEIESARNGRSKNLITLENFKDNLSKIDEWAFVRVRVRTPLGRGALGLKLVLGLRAPAARLDRAERAVLQVEFVHGVWVQAARPGVDSLGRLPLADPWARSHSDPGVI